MTKVNLLQGLFLLQSVTVGNAVVAKLRRTTRQLDEGQIFNNTTKLGMKPVGIGPKKEVRVVGGGKVTKLDEYPYIVLRIV
jgi:hypothetical protein